MKNTIDYKKQMNNESNVAFIDSEENPVKYGTLVGFETNEKGLIKKSIEDLYLVWHFENGELGFLDVNKFIQCGKQGFIPADWVDFSTIYPYNTILARKLEKMILEHINISAWELQDNPTP